MLSLHDFTTRRWRGKQEKPDQWEERHKIQSVVPHLKGIHYWITGNYTLAWVTTKMKWLIFELKKKKINLTHHHHSFARRRSAGPPPQTIPGWGERNHGNHRFSLNLVTNVSVHIQKIKIIFPYKTVFFNNFVNKQGKYIDSCVPGPDTFSNALQSVHLIIVAVTTNSGDETEHLPVLSRMARLFPFFKTISSWYMAGLGGLGVGSALLGSTMLMPCGEKKMTD